MEATAGILRGHLESRRSSPVRWFLDRVAQLGRFPDSSGSTVTAQDRWQEMFWAEAKPARPAALARTRTAHLEQAELWTARPATRPAAAVSAVAPVASGVAKAHTMTRSAARMVPAGQPYAERQQRVRTEDIARLLEANRAVYGRLVPVKSFSLPRCSFSAQLNLWKGSKLGTSFVTGC